MIFIKEFKQLSPEELYRIFKLRFDVFVIEQQCIYNEFDNIDPEALHLYLKEKDEIVAYLRLYKKDNTAIFGRFVVAPSYRRKKVGSLLVRKCIEYIQQEWSTSILKISAQTYLRGFYATFGFKAISEEYDEDGIMHVDMSLRLPSTLL